MRKTTFSPRLLVNHRMLTRVVGWLLLIESAFMLIPTLTSIFYKEDDWIAFSGTTVLTAVVGFMLSRFVRPTSRHLGKRDGFLLTALVWIVFSLFGLLPFMFGSVDLCFSDAFFEAMSGFTTTGASVITDTTKVSHGLHIWRAMMQWIGGMGIILFTLAVIPMLNHAGGMQMFNAEVTGITHDKIRPRINQTAKSLWAVYCGLTFVLVVLLSCGPMSVFESICHALGTISTGGYSVNSDGISVWGDSWYVKIVMTVFMFLGGVNFGLIYKTVHGDFAAVKTSDVLRVYVQTICAVMLVFVASILLHKGFCGWQAVTIDPLFQIVSTITSTGYSLEELTIWGPAVLSLTFVMMFFGACAGSTSGGAKIDRILYLYKNCRNEVYRCIYPNAIMSVKFNGRIANPDLVTKVIAFLCLYLILVAVGGILLSLFDVPIVDAFFSSFSCMSNTGFGAATTGYGAGYETLPGVAKWILSALMLTGRLEIYTILVLLMPAFWRK